jgi:hypothetical protein
LLASALHGICKHQLAPLSHTQTNPHSFTQELDGKSRLVAELTLSLQREERARSAAEQASERLRERVHALEREAGLRGEMEGTKVGGCMCGLCGGGGGNVSEEVPG